MSDDRDGTFTLAKQGGITFVGNVLNRGLGFLFIVAITRLVEPETFGAFTLGLAVISFALGFSNLNLHRSIDFFVPGFLADREYGKAKGALLNASLFGLGGSVFGAVLIAISASWLSTIFQEPTLAYILPLLSVALPLATTNRILLASFNSIKKLKYRVYTRNVLQPGGRVLLTTLFLIGGMGITGLVLGHLLALLLAAIGGILLLVLNTPWIREARIDSVSRRSLLSYSLPLMFAGVIYAMVGQIDFFALGYFRPSADVGIYKVSYLLAGNILIVLRAITPVFKPMISEKKDELSVLQSRYRLATRWTALFTIPPALTLILAPQTYLSLLFTPEYALASSSVVVLVGGYLLHTSVGPEGMMLEGLGYTRLTLLNTVLLITTNSVLDVLFIPRLGIVGAAIGTAVATGVAVVAGVVEIYYLVGIHPFTKKLGKIWIAGVPAIVTGLIFTSVLNSSLVLALLLPLGVGVVYLTSLILTESFTDDDVEIAAKVDERLGIDFVKKIVVIGNS